MAVRDIPPNLMLIIRSFTNAPWWETNCLGSLLLQPLKLYSVFSMMATSVHFNGNEKFIVFLIWPFPIPSLVVEIDESTGISVGRKGEGGGDKPTVATIDRRSISIERELSTQTSFKKLARARYTFLLVDQYWLLWVHTIESSSFSFSLFFLFFFFFHRIEFN